MSRIRSSMLLLGLAVAAMLIGALRLITEPAQLPPGSSSSAQSDGALALYTWLSDLGGQTQRLTDASIDPSVGTVLLVSPASVPDQATSDAIDAVADRGGTIVLAGDSVQFLIFARGLGVTVEPASTSSDTVTTPDGLTLLLSTRYRVGADDAEPLLVRDDGALAGLRMPYRQGSLIVIASPEPFTNAGLAFEPTAQFVYRQVVSPALATGAPVAFDEVGRSSGLTVPDAPSLDQLVFRTAAGRAVLYAALLTFFFLLLAGRRLGPPVYLRSAAEAPRTMYEHVQMLANLYRRAGQLDVVRSALLRHYSRPLARGTLPPTQAAALDAALLRLTSAGTESEVIDAVTALDGLQLIGPSRTAPRTSPEGSPLGNEALRH